MKFSLAFAYPAQVLRHVPTKERRRVWQVVDAVSVNILATRARELVAEVRACRPDVSIRTHSYTGGLYALPGGSGQRPPGPELDGSSLTTVASAMAQGRRDGAIAVELKADAHEADAEAGMWRGVVYKRTADGMPIAWRAKHNAPELHDAYLYGLSQTLNLPPLWDLSFLEPARFYPHPPARSDFWHSSFVARSVMGYGPHDDGFGDRALGYYHHLLDRVADRTSLPTCLYVGVGRKSGRVVVGSDEGLIGLVLSPRPNLAEVCGYVGNGAWRQLVKGNESFSPIVDLWPQLRTLSLARPASTPPGVTA